MIKTKEILKKSYQNVKKNFWIYLAVVLISEAIAGMFDGSSQIFTQIGAYLNYLSIENTGLINNNDIFVAGNSGAGMITSIVSLAAMIFLLNPLEIGVNKFFLEGVCTKNPDIQIVISPFKSSYLDVVKTTFINTVLSDAVIFVVTFAYVLCAGAAALLMTMQSVAMIVLSVALIVVLTIVYCMATMMLLYNFKIVKYIIGNGSNFKFTVAYGLSKAMLKGKRFDVFKVDIIYGMITVLPLIAIFAMLISGFVIEELMIFTIIGCVALVPYIILALFVSLFRNAAFANIYENLKRDMVKSTTVEIDSNYEPPKNSKPISYANEDKDETEDNVTSDNDE